MEIELVPYEAEKHAKILSKICYEAFASFQTRHGFPPDFPVPEAAEGMFQMFGDREHIYGIVATAGGKPIGSNFLWMHDVVAGVGPITVDPDAQSAGVGRLLMLGVLDEAARRGIAEVRLVQDGHNQASLSLYASLGFGQRHCLSLMGAVPFEIDVSGVRPMTGNDLDAVESLGRDIYRTSRRNEVASFIAGGVPGFIRERAGEVVGYFLPGMVGHGVARTDADLLALVSSAARHLSPELARFFCPLGEHALFRAALAAKCRSIKTMNLMTFGPYEEPKGSWLPSIAY